MEGNTQNPGERVAAALQRRLRIGPLDRLLINAVVDTRSRVEGALGEKGLDAAVKEFVRLNGRRHQSYFHAGFRDAIFDRPPAPLPADNDARRRWYWTGMTMGWARTEILATDRASIRRDPNCQGIGRRCRPCLAECRHPNRHGSEELWDAKPNCPGS